MSAGAPQVVIVGGGPAGLAAAIELRRRDVDVLVLEREADPGGIPATPATRASASATCTGRCPGRATPAVMRSWPAPPAPAFSPKRW
jgi:cation diffusion facilitator CzcD-associated flavoprotein CzcO